MGDKGSHPRGFIGLYGSELETEPNGGSAVKVVVASREGCLEVALLFWRDWD